MSRTPEHRVPTPPGTILLHEFIEPMNLTEAKVARAIAVPYQRLNAVVRGARAVSPSMALRLARYFGTSPYLWVTLQLAVDLYKAQLAEADALEAIRPVTASV